MQQDPETARTPHEISATVTHQLAGARLEPDLVNHLLAFTVADVQRLNWGVEVLREVQTGGQPTRQGQPGRSSAAR